MPSNPVDEYDEAVDHLWTDTHHFGNLAVRLGERWVSFSTLLPRVVEILPDETRDEFLSEIMKLGGLLEELSEAIQADTMAHIKVVNAVAGVVDYQQGIIEKTIKEFTKK